MSNRPLSFQIWLIIAGITTGICLLMMLILPAVLGNFFTRELFATIESSQMSILYIRNPGEKVDPKEFRTRVPNVDIQNNRTVSHFIMLGNGQIISKIISVSPLSSRIQNIIANNIQNQNESVKHYSFSYDGRTLYYVIRSIKINNTPIYLVSYMWNNYRDELVRTLFERIALILGLLLIVSWIPAILLARYLSRPLVRLEEHVKAIANRELNQPVLIDRKDEIGRLAASIERMRQQLRMHDEAQQSLMQHISHELKTPVMVIRSYAQAIHDGLFPKGDLSSSVEVIEHESSRLEKRIRDLLYLTKLDYLSKRIIKREPVRIDELIRSVIERLRWNRNDLQWEVELDEFEVAVDPEQWNVLLENLLENQIRYASTKIYVKTSSKPLLQIHIGNDGPPLDDEIKSSLFQAFRKGSKGQFGLGLTIAKRIADLHGVNLEAENKDHGVSFTLTFP